MESRPHLPQPPAERRLPGVGVADVLRQCAFFFCGVLTIVICVCACGCMCAACTPRCGSSQTQVRHRAVVLAGSLVDARPDALLLVLLVLLVVVGSLPWEGVALRLCTGDDAAQFAFVHPKTHIAVPDTLPGASTRASVTFEAPATARAQPYVRRYRLTAPDGGFDCASVVSPALSRILLKWIVRYCCGALRAIRHRVRSLGRH
jgi:hypothetical protein